MQVRKRTINGIFLARAAASSRSPAAYRRVGDRWEPVFWHQSLTQTREVALGLAALAGVSPGDRVAIVSGTRPEWVGCDHAVQCLGAVTVGLYESMSPEQLGFVLRHSGARVVIAEDDRLLDRVLSAVPDGAEVRLFCTVEPGRPRPGVAVASLDEVRRRGEAAHLEDPERFEAQALAVEPDDLATLVYTSGTTGEPKGAMLTHGNLFYAVQAAADLMPRPHGNRSVCYLPLAHILQRYAVYLGEWHGVEGYFSADVHALGTLLREVGPGQIAAVPRILEKVRDRILEGVEKLPPRRAALFRWAYSVGSQVSQRRLQNRAVLPHLLVQHELADRLVLRRVREQLGGELRFVVSGGAPLSPAISEFFHALGILVIEGYGLTETSAPVSTNTPDAFRFGTVGRPIPGTEVRIAEDGEVLVRGPGVFRGYYRDPEGTAGAFTDDGLFRTGDLGEMTDDGYLRITGRKKELIVTSGGKNVAPSLVEDLLQRGRAISQAVVVGDRRPYLAALVWPDPEVLAAVARDERLPEAGADLARHPQVVARLRADIEAANARLSRHETVRRFDLLPAELSVERGEVTPTLKVRRAVVAERHREAIDALYSGGGYDVGGAADAPEARPAAAGGG